MRQNVKRSENAGEVNDYTTDSSLSNISAEPSYSACSHRPFGAAATQQRVDRVTPPFQHELLLDRLHHQIGDHTALVSTGKCPVNFFFTSSGTLKFTLATVASHSNAAMPC